MDESIASLARDLTVMLTPLLPYLLKAGDAAAEKAGQKLGEGAWNQAQNLWRRLWPKINSNPASLEAVKDLAEMPDDTDVQAAMRLQLRKLLLADNELAKELALVFSQSSEIRTTIITATKNSVAAQNIIGSSVNVGNKSDSQS
jgi:hypothetical protein